jgi:hypothetical protein
MLQDAKKFRLGIVGGVKGKYGFMSEECGLESAIPKRNKNNDVFQMKYDMVIVKPDAAEVMVWNQLHSNVTAHA